MTMTIIVFLIDTSASMCQKAYVNGVQRTFLDIAKGAVETFLKYRQRTQECLGDRYMLLTFEDPPFNVKAGWKESHATFLNELKNLQSIGYTTMGDALKNAFDLLNLNRMQSGIDTYGQGRCPFYLEPSVIIVITDGGQYTFRNGVQQEIILPLNAQVPGTKFTKEPFRWDQRLFSLVLRIPGNKPDDRVDGKIPHDESPIERMCEVTGGRSYRCKSLYVLNQCIESLVQKVVPGVMLHFEPLLPKELKDGEEQDLVFPITKKMIYVHKHPTQKSFPAGYWPLPEPYWPDPKLITLPPRDAHPKIRIITPCVDEPQILRNFPMDKYEVEASPLTLQILSKREFNKCWPVTIASRIHGFDAPFGYLKASANLSQVYLHVLSYNYPALLPLLNELVQKFTMNPPNDWMYKFSSYVRSIPQYYCPFLRRALLNVSVPYPLLQFILPENIDNYCSPNISNYLKQVKNTAKLEQESLCNRIQKHSKLIKPPYRSIEAIKLNCGVPLRRDIIRNPLVRETFKKLHSEIGTYESFTVAVPTISRQSSAKTYRNPFDIPRRDLIDEICRMRDTFLKLSKTSVSLATKDAGHCFPISEMGNYQEYTKNKVNPLRELEPTNVRQHMFGNPYKKDKHMVMVDEAEIDNDAMLKNNQNNMKKAEPQIRHRKRKPGPIRKDYIFQRTSSDSRPSSPVSTSSIGSTSDYEDDSASETSSIASDDQDRLVVSFDFNESEEFSINGHIRNFINCGLEDLDESQSIQNHPPIVAVPALPSLSVPSMLPPQLQIINNGNDTIHHSINNASIPSVHNRVELITQSHNQPQTPTLAAGVTPTILNFNQPTTNGLSNSTLSPHHSIPHNDINDAQEISRILQQCHNGITNEQKLDSPVEKMEIDEPPKNNGIINNNEILLDTGIKKEYIRTLTPSPINDELNDCHRENIRKNNLKLRNQIFKDIRRPGRNYSQLIDRLNLIEGDIEIKSTFIDMCINETLRFRRQRMAESIQEWRDKHLVNIPNSISSL